MDTSDQAKSSKQWRVGREHPGKDKKRRSVSNSVQVKIKCVHEVIDVLSNMIRDGFRFTPSLDHVGDGDHENDLNLIFEVIFNQIQGQKIGCWIILKIMSAFNPCIKMAPNGS